MSRLLTTAPAKINLSLHVLGRRADGYHLLESLVAFADAVDVLSLVPGEGISLSVDGPEAGSIGGGADNLVVRAHAGLARRVPGLVGGSFHLVKNLPVASGIGGGSSDAAAALRLLADANGIPEGDALLMEVAAELGADVPVCLARRSRIMRGIGEHLADPVEIPELPALLVNPRIPVETAAVFRMLGLSAGEMLPAAPPVEVPPTSDRARFIAGLAGQRNDLAAPAIRIAPEIALTLAALDALQECRLARMSGSGATVFGLFDTPAAAQEAASRMAVEHPGWWVRAATIGG